MCTRSEASRGFTIQHLIDRHLAGVPAHFASVTRAKWDIRLIMREKLAIYYSPSINPTFCNAARPAPLPRLSSRAINTACWFFAFSNTNNSI